MCWGCWEIAFSAAFPTGITFCLADRIGGGANFARGRLFGGSVVLCNKFSEVSVISRGLRCGKGRGGALAGLLDTATEEMVDFGHFLITLVLIDSQFPDVLERVGSIGVSDSSREKL